MRPKKKISSFVKVLPEDELFFRRKLYFLENCCHHVGWNVKPGEINIELLIETANSIEAHGREMRQKLLSIK